MLTKFSFDIPDKVEGQSFNQRLIAQLEFPVNIGMGMGTLNFQEEKENPGTQRYGYHGVFVRSAEADKFKAVVIACGGAISREEDGTADLVKALLTEASSSNYGVTLPYLIRTVSQDVAFNLTNSDEEYLFDLAHDLIQQQRLLSLDHLVRTNPAEQAWSSNSSTRAHNQLLTNIRENKEAITELLSKVSSHWAEEDMLYRFYHQSFKVYGLQNFTNELVNMLRKLDPRIEPRELNDWFELLLKEGTGKVFERSHNQEWLIQTRPILEAFYHAKQILTYALKYGSELATAPNMLPSGWALVLYVYDLR